MVERPLDIDNLAENLTDYSLEFIRNNSAAAAATGNSHRRRPFALYHAFTNVHTPLKVHDKFKAGFFVHFYDYPLIRKVVPMSFKEKYLNFFKGV